MAIYSISSNNIQISPISISKENSVGRTLQYGYTGRIATFEPSLVDRYTNILDYNTYIISGLTCKVNSNTLIIDDGDFIINGYHITTKGISIPINIENDILNYVAIKLNIEEASTTYEGIEYKWKELVGSDQDGKYTGISIEITSDLSTLSNALILGTLKKIDSQITFTEDSTNTFKYRAENAKIEITVDSGLLLPFINELTADAEQISEYTTNISEWLAELAILDDGEFIEGDQS